MRRKTEMSMMYLAIDSDPETYCAEEKKKFSFFIKTPRPMLKIEKRGFRWRRYFCK